MSGALAAAERLCELLTAVAQEVWDLGFGVSGLGLGFRV